MEKDGRHNGIDVLKIIATIFVVVLHVNGFLSDTIPLGQFSLSTNVLYHISEAVAYPAIHLFVMVTAYFTIEKGTNKKNNNYNLEPDIYHMYNRISIGCDFESTVWHKRINTFIISFFRTCILVCIRLYSPYANCTNFK